MTEIVRVDPHDERALRAEVMHEMQREEPS